MHTSILRYHGFLCIQNCLVDSNWTVKLTNFVTEEIVNEKMSYNELKPFKISNTQVCFFSFEKYFSQLKNWVNTTRKIQKKVKMVQTILKMKQAVKANLVKKKKIRIIKY